MISTAGSPSPSPGRSSRGTAGSDCGSPPPGGVNWTLEICWLEWTTRRIRSPPVTLLANEVGRAAPWTASRTARTKLGSIGQSLPARSAVVVQSRTRPVADDPLDHRGRPARVVPAGEHADGPPLAPLVHRHDLAGRDPLQRGGLQLQEALQRRRADGLDDQAPDLLVDQGLQRERQDRARSGGRAGRCRGRRRASPRRRSSGPSPRGRGGRAGRPARASGPRRWPSRARRRDRGDGRGSRPPGRPRRARPRPSRPRWTGARRGSRPRSRTVPTTARRPRGGSAASPSPGRRPSGGCPPAARRRGAGARGHAAPTPGTGRSAGPGRSAGARSPAGSPPSACRRRGGPPWRRRARATSRCGSGPPSDSRRRRGSVRSSGTSASSATLPTSSAPTSTIRTLDPLLAPASADRGDARIPAGLPQVGDDGELPRRIRAGPQDLVDPLQHRRPGGVRGGQRHAQGRPREVLPARPFDLVEDRGARGRGGHDRAAVLRADGAEERGRHLPGALERGRPRRPRSPCSASRRSGRPGWTGRRRRASAPAPSG